MPLGRLEIDSLETISCISKQDLHFGPVLCAQAVQAVHRWDTKSKHYIPEGDYRRALHPSKKDHNVWAKFFSELQNATVRQGRALNGFVGVWKTLLEMSKLFNTAILKWKPWIFLVWNHKGVLVPFKRCQTRWTLCPWVMPDGWGHLGGRRGQLHSGPAIQQLAAHTTPGGAGRGRVETALSICCTPSPPKDISQGPRPELAITIPSELKDVPVQPFSKTHGDHWTPRDLEAMLLCWRTAPLPVHQPQGEAGSYPGQRSCKVS